jgi:SAM-dependent methyltransferase
MRFLRRLFFNWMYYRRPPWDSGVSPPELLAFIASHPPGRALDLGCGTGTNAITLARHGWQVTGVDFAWKAIAQARQKARQAGVQVDFKVADVLQLPGIIGKFDLILDIGCFHSLDATARKTYVKNLGELLQPGGFFLMYAFLSKPGDSVSGLTEDDLALFRDRFRLVERRDGTERGMRPSAWFTFEKVRGRER